ncbi:MAG TPA: carbamoyltransferase HypF [Candidatus Avidesulfovibrio excrementigallinarum]|nr:carbamoyltransferase HypF [Candidatus Avidesulfovibrio excrementigallinarum]
MERRRLIISGQVQGVGFRPFVYREAVARGLSGYVGNTPDGVIIEVQGEAAALDGLESALRHNPPPLARIVTLEVAAVPVRADEDAFCIRHSDAGGHGHSVLISPDVATCDDCLRELFDPADRRYLYPFINCTNCGPRYTLTRSIPYDRATTSMACFPLCPDCAGEYADPANRRFHAQPNACPVCGPKLWTALPGGGSSRPPAGPQTDYLAPLEETARALLAGEIVAIKGLGGFHLACDAHNTGAIARLRERKRRPHKALAVMVAGTEAVCRLALPRREELTLLTGHTRPITLIARRSPQEGGLPALLAPDVDTLGFMLPYTPLHHVLLRLVERLAPAQARPAALVMTSGNAGGDPICLGNREALHALRGIADRFLLHDRDILIRADDSVARVLGDGTVQFLRRARGYVPSPLPLPGACAPHDAARPVAVATGADLKNTLCLTRGGDAFVSQHIGDLGNPAINAFHGEIVSHLTALLEVRPAAVIRDLHPDYHSTRLAEALAEAGGGLPVHAVQHHAAHLFAVLGEHRHSGPALGLILDGTGYGEDRTIWGGELLLAGDTGDVTRVGRLSRFKLPGGEAAIREPWRLACDFIARLDLPQAAAFFPKVDPARLNGVLEVARHGLGVPTSSCGRLFDAAAALLGLCGCITYEGQAAIRLEHAQDHGAAGALPWVLRETDDGAGPLVELDADSLVRELIVARLAGVAVPVLARQFHRGLIEGLAALCAAAARRTGVTTVALGGGVFLNRTVSDELPPALAALGLTPLRSRELPPGDGAISYGQAVWFVKKKLQQNPPAQRA